MITGALICALVIGLVALLEWHTHDREEVGGFGLMLLLVLVLLAAGYGV